MNKTVIHLFNILIGILSIGYGLFFSWGVLAFGPEGNMLVIIGFPLAITIIWSTIYYLQMKYQTVKSFLFLLLIEVVLFILVFFINRPEMNHDMIDTLRHIISH